MKRYDVGKSENEKNNKGLKYDLKSMGQQKETEAAEQEKKKRRIKITCIAAAVLIPCMIFAGIMYNGYVKTNKAYEAVEREYTDLAMSYVTEDTETDIEDENMAKKVDFSALTEKESDIYAWITLPGTNIDYPILQSGEDKDDEDYWLNHNLDGTIGYPGTIFTEKMFGKDFKTFNTIIYGHNMRNQTMFGELHELEKEKSLFDKNEFVYIYTPDMTYKYQIVCASVISNSHLATAYNGYQTENQRQKFIDYLLSNAVRSRTTDTGIYDSYITMSTCTDSDVSRFVVLAKCIDKVSNKEYD